MTFGMRAKHEKANELRRIHLDDLERFRADPLRARHLLPAEREELVLQTDRRLLLEDLAVDRVRPFARATGGQEILAALLVRHPQVIPLRAPLLVPKKLRVSLERPDTPHVAAA